MTEVFEKVTTDEAGNILQLDHVQKPSLRVNSDEIIPKGLGQGSEALIIDKMAVAVCDGRDNWYSTGGKSAAAGQTWAALC